MKVLVTGATGFIGSEIVSELSKNNFEIFSLTSSFKKAAHLSANDAGKILIADITSKASLAALDPLENIDAIIHSAGLAHQFGETKKEAFDAVNVEGTRNVAELAVRWRAKQFILIGSTAVYESRAVELLEKYGEKDEKAEFVSKDENFPVNPQTLYAQSKLEAERDCIKICAENDLPLTVFRLAPVIGEANVGNVERLIETIDRRRFVWIGKGANYKSLIYKNDVARACLAVLEQKKDALEIFNLAAPPVRMKNFVEEIAARLGKKISGLYIPANFPPKIFLLNSKFVGNKRIAKIGDTIEKWLADDVYSATKIKERYGFEPATSISEGIRRQIEWYRARRKSSTAGEQSGGE